VGEAVSIAAMNCAWQQQLSPTPKLILMALADAANDHSICWPSVSTVATKCCVSVRTVRRVMQKLVDRRLMLSEQRYRKDGSCSSNRYRLRLEGSDNLSPAPDSNDTPPGQKREGPPATGDIPGTTIGNTKALIMKKSSIILVAALLSVCTAPVNSQEQDIRDRMLYSRAVDAVVWAMPIMNFKFYRDALIGAGVGPNDVGYYSEVQDWRFQTATPNNTTPYILAHWTVKDGPIVVEIPAATQDVGIFGTLMDTWQRPLDDVGAAGRDRGRGAKYLLLPPGYDGPLLPGALVYQQRTHNGFAVLRPIIADSSAENLAKASEYVRQIKIYRLGDEPKTEYVDLYGKLLEMTPVLDKTIYEEIHEFINEEPVEEMNLTMMGLLSRIGIRKDEPFEPNEDLQAVYSEAAPEALEYMIDQYHRRLTPFFYEGKKWSSLLPPGFAESELTYEFPTHFDYVAKGALYYAVITSVKNYGAATFYLDLAETPDGKWLDGGKNYKLVMPPNVPVRDFSAITTYDLETASYLRDIEPSSVDSNMSALQRNADGSVDIYFGPKAAAGLESNWLPTDPERRFFLLARFYGPEPEIVNGSFELNDIELID